jgi:hypothetical protein
LKLRVGVASIASGASKHSVAHTVHAVVGSDPHTTVTSGTRPCAERLHCKPWPHQHRQLAPPPHERAGDEDAWRAQNNQPPPKVSRVQLRRRTATRYGTAALAHVVQGAALAHVVQEASSREFQV